MDNNDGGEWACRTRVYYLFLRTALDMQSRINADPAVADRETVVGPLVARLKAAHQELKGYVAVVYLNEDAVFVKEGEDITPVLLGDIRSIEFFSRLIQEAFMKKLSEK